MSTLNILMCVSFSFYATYIFFPLLVILYVNFSILILKKLKSIMILSINPEKTIIQEDTCTSVFIAALFTVARTWKKPKCSTAAAAAAAAAKSLQSCPTLCNPMNCSTPGLPVHHQLPEFTQTHVHRVSDGCESAISSSVVPFSCPQSLPASESFPMSQLFASGGQSIGVSALTSFLPKNTQDWSPLEWTGWISLPSKGLSRVFSNTTVQKHQFFVAQLSSQSNSVKTTGKTIALTRRTFVGKVMSLLFNMLST